VVVNAVTVDNYKVIALFHVLNRKDFGIRRLPVCIVRTARLASFAVADFTDIYNGVKNGVDRKLSIPFIRDVELLNHFSP